MVTAKYANRREQIIQEGYVKGFRGRLLAQPYGVRCTDGPKGMAARRKAVRSLDLSIAGELAKQPFCAI